MADKKYFYMRLKEDFFDNEAMVILEDMPDGIIYQNILLKMYCRSLKTEGRLMFNGVIPYNPQMLASVTRQQVGTVEKAIDVFEKLGLIEILENGAIYMLNIQEFIGESSTEADRKRNYRERINRERTIAGHSMDSIGTNKGQMSGHLSDRDIDIYKDIYIDRDKDKDYARAREENSADAETPPPPPEKKDNCPYKEIERLYNEMCGDVFPKIRDITGNRRKAVNARWTANPSLNTFIQLFDICRNSEFLKGKNNLNWKADFDFMMRADKFDRILEGAYNDNSDIAKQNSPESHASYDLHESDERTRRKYQNL